MELTDTIRVRVKETTLKHLRGAHDQKSHGRRGGASSNSGYPKGSYESKLSGWINQLRSLHEKGEYEKVYRSFLTSRSMLRDAPWSEGAVSAAKSLIDRSKQGKEKYRAASEYIVSNELSTFQAALDNPNPYGIYSE